MSGPKKRNPMGVMLLCILAGYLASRAGYLYEHTSGALLAHLNGASGFLRDVLRQPLFFPRTSISLQWGAVGLAAAVLGLLYYYFGRHKLMIGKEHGSAVWGTPEDIKSFIDPVPENNVLLTDTEQLSMAPRMKVTRDDDYNRNKNVLIVGGSGSRKTRGYIKPNLLQMSSNYVVTDPKGSL